ncbi:MAG: leucine-rich repeat domain-containing protein [Planctomycetota bacterium]|jgi:hypothetical protein
MARETTKAKSRWLPWLVVLGMFIVLVVLPFGIWLAVQSYRANQFCQAATAIEALGHDADVKIGESGPEWLRSLFGEYFLARAKWVWYPRGASDEDLVHLRGIPSAGFLDLTGTRVTDAGLAEVAALRGLSHVLLCGTAITDVGVAQLLALEQLSVLHLDYTAITDEGLQTLARLPRLQELRLADTCVTKGGAGRFTAARPYVSLIWRTAPSETHRRAAAALLQSGATVEFNDYEHQDPVVYPGTSVYVGNYVSADSFDFSNLEKLDDLRTLSYFYGERLDVAKLEILGRLHGLEYLSLQTISDNDLAHLKGLKNLKTLYLAGTQITDAGLGHLKTLSNLEALNLSNTLITGAGLKHLESLVRLRDLQLSGTQVTDKVPVHGS